jgi:hypothetical protein
LYALEVVASGIDDIILQTPTFQPLWRPELPVLLELFKVNLNMKIGCGWGLDL